MAIITHTNTANRWHIHADSVADALAYIRATKPNKDLGECQGECLPATSWNGNITWGQALEMAVTGWKDGREQSAALASTLTLTIPPASSLQAQEFHSVAGYRPDPAAAAAGAPDCMIARGPETNPRRPIIRMAINMGASASVEPEQIQRYGAAILAAVDMIEQSGRRIELTAYTHNDIGEKRTAQSVTLKEAEDALDVDRLAFWLVHPAGLRRLMFALMSRSPKINPGTGLGRPNKEPPATMTNDPALFIVPGMGARGHGAPELDSDEGAARFVESLINQAIRGEAEDAAT